MITDKDQIGYLNFLCRTYDGINKLIVSTKNRIQSLAPEVNMKTNDVIQAMESQKGKISRRVGKELDFWPIWSEWMKQVPGIGPAIGGNLILLYYYRFMPICPKCATKLKKKDKTFWCDTCEKSVKGEGNLQHKIEIKDFPMISSWWHYMGRHCDENGVMPKRAKGVISDWSNTGRQIGFQIGDQFNRQSPDHSYKAYLLKRKARHLKKNDQRDKPWTTGHIHNAGRNEAVKMFLSHFWQVARGLDGLSITVPYIVAKDPVHKIIEPFYWHEFKEAA